MGLVYHRVERQAFIQQPNVYRYQQVDLLLSSDLFIITQQGKYVEMDNN